MAAPLVAMVAASCDGVNARTIGRSNEPIRGPVLAADDAPGDVFGEAVPPHAAMTMPEVSEFVAESLFSSRFPPRNVRPAPFGSADGFRFEVSYAGTAGVKREAIVAGAVLDKRLHVIAYEGTALYHFGKYRHEVEHILRSVHRRR